MKCRRMSSLLLVIAIFLTVQATQVFAGPPLVCHSIEIGDAESLPWGSGVWDNSQIRLDDDAFVARTLEILSPDAGVLLRMETIRRATIHAAENPKAASKFLNALKERWLAQATSKSPNGFVYLDYGYALACYAQMNVVTDNESRGTSGQIRREMDTDEAPDAYGFVLKALELEDEKGSIEFALALMTLHPSRSSHAHHLKQAMVCVAEQSLLARNLVKHFGGERGRTLDELRKYYWSERDAERG